MCADKPLGQIDAEPDYICAECFKVLPKSEALQHNIDSGHKIKRLTNGGSKETN